MAAVGMGSNAMNILLTIVHVFVCLFLVGVVLLQSGRAGGMGVLSGAATQTVFGGRGAGGFLAKATAGCAPLFLLTSPPGAAPPPPAPPPPPPGAPPPPPPPAAP